MIFAFVNKKFRDYIARHKKKKKSSATKQVDFANCSCGCENNLLKLCDQIDFDLGVPEDRIYKDLTYEQIQTMVMATKYEKNPTNKLEEKKDAVILNSIRGACSNSFFF